MSTLLIEHGVRIGRIPLGATTSLTDVSGVRVSHTARVSLLADRRQTQPYGLNGGEPGRAGENVLIRSGKEIPLPGKGAVTVHAGETVSLRTPGGGGYGNAAKRDRGAVERDRREGRMC